MAHATQVLIVGAGASGLRVAELLSEAAIDCVVLEARDRVGGRLLSTDQGIDLGASWFWDNEPDVRATLERIGATGFDQYLAGNMMFQVPNGVQELDGNPLGVPSQRVLGGMQTLARGIANRLADGMVHLSTPVISIEFHDSGVRVFTQTHEWNADVVVVAVPPATALAHIRFTPELPEALVQRARRTPVWMGAVTKVVAVYDGPFWRDAGLAGSAMSHVGPLREIHDLSDPRGNFGALFGFAREKVTQASVLAQLDAIFGPLAMTPQKVHIKDWSVDPFTSPPGVFQLNDYQNFGSQVLRESHCQGRLYLTTTETAVDAPGHVQGALSAAARTVRTILSGGVKPG